MSTYKILAVTGCPTGIAHTYMAQEALEEAAKKRNISIKVETHGQTGIENEFSQSEIDNADGIIIAADKAVGIDRFDGKKLINVSVSMGMKEPDKLIDQILNDSSVPIYHSKDSGEKMSTSNQTSGNGVWHTIYVDLMNGVSHMLPLVVAGGVLTAVSFFWGIYSAVPGNVQYNSFAYILKTIGGITMNLMVPVLCAYIAEAIGQQTGLVVGFATGMIAFTNGTGFLGGILGGFLAGYIVVLLEKIFRKLPKSLNGLKAIFIFPVLGVFSSGIIMWFLSTPMKNINTSMMSFLKGMQNSNPIVLGLLVGIMCAADMGGPINKAAYVTGTTLLAQGNYYFMAGVSAACIAPPLATGFAVLLNKKAYSSSERSAGYVNFLLGSTHITEGAIPFATKNPLINIPIFMVGSAVAAILSYVSRITVPAPHGGFIILPLVNKPFLWVIYILIGALISGILLALAANIGQGNKVEAATNRLNGDTSAIDVKSNNSANKHLDEVLSKENIKLDVEVNNQKELFEFLADQAIKEGLSDNKNAIITKFEKREQEGSTGMEQGIAIPHAKDDSIKKAAMFVVRLKDPIEWKTFDQKPVNIIIGFFIPEHGSQEHLNYLSQVSKLLMHDSFVNDLKNSQTVDEIYQMFISQTN
ncbi:fructose-specific PTS transporter subunit EIIC [Xylocopilactobacillus apis]|uniref:PTS fructose transporter subunit IIABC n=1 Tax=Xylocopilactobacillus apis TaxID=2932183 RepID=A0AAU9DKE4_9LACO|nr:fructose-specific PTS transporter subunit EIIC [Xylocopilactobacillus apis]BDR55954.1 PTS fructose transporter subunit IIABC [Xylocopilactobacillus apis]